MWRGGVRVEHICLPPLLSGGASLVPPLAPFSTSRSSVGSRGLAAAGRPLDRATVSSPLHVATQHADFPHCRAHHLLQRHRLWDLILLGAYFRPVASHSIGVKQPSSVVQPPPIPSFPSPKPFRFLSKSLRNHQDGFQALQPLTYSLPSQVLQINGRLLSSRSLPSPMLETLQNGRAPSLRRHYFRFIATTEPSPPPLSSLADFPVSPVYNGLPCSDDFRAGTRRASPVA